MVSGENLSLNLRLPYLPIIVLLLFYHKKMEKLLLPLHLFFTFSAVLSTNVCTTMTTADLLSISYQACALCYAYVPTYLVRIESVT